MGCAAESDSIVALEEALTVCGTGATVTGIDVSHWQNTIDWDAVKGAGVQFAIVRVSDGVGTFDKQFSNNWNGAKRVGIKRGAYQFFRPNQNIDQQADLFINSVGQLDAGDLPPVLDVEADDGASKATMVAGIRQWLNRVESALGKRPIIYTGGYFWDAHVGSNEFVSYPLWVAHYGPSCPNIPSAWSTWTMWQYTSSGKVNGIAGNVDTNVFQGDMAALETFARGMAECGDGFCNGDENGATCEVDCPVCKPVNSDGERIIDNDDVCLTLGGNLQYWREDTTTGYGGSLRWTYTIADPEASNTCSWDLSFNASGRYRVEAYAPQPFAMSAQAKYEVGHAGQVSTQVVNQSTANGWVSLGEFEFAMGANQYVLVGDNTGEARDLEVKLACDALRVVPLDVPDGGNETTQPPSGSGTPGPSGIDGGCSVSAARGANGAWPGGLLLTLALVAFRRRRTR